MKNEYIKVVNTGGIIRKKDYAFIPPDILNVDYQEYLSWIEEGNQPEEITLEGME
jgi:hypothetical protein